MIISESANLELKREFTDEIKKEVVAFANTAGGIIYVGVNDDGTVRGIEDVDGEMLRLSSSIRQSIKPDITMFVSYVTEIIEDKPVIKITVQRGNARPYYLAGKGLRSAGVYVREGSETVPASEAAIFKMSKESTGERFEELRSHNQKLSFSELTRQFASRNITFEKRDKKRLNIITEEGQYTNLGLLLSDQCTHTIKVAAFEGTDTSVFKDRREFEGSLFKQLDETYSWLNFHNCTNSSFEGLYRIDTRDYPAAAVRESLLNAIVHRDYSISASILIHLFSDRMEIISAGGLVEGLRRDDIMLGVSAARNVNLSKVFYRLHLIEAYGSGLPRIYSCYGDVLSQKNVYAGTGAGNKVLSPEISVSDNAFKLTLPNVNYWLSKNGSSGTDASPFQMHRETEILQMVVRSGFVTRKNVQERLGISQSLAVKVLSAMVEKGLVRQIGKGRAVRYVKAGS